MPPVAASLVLICGDDDFSAKQRARQVFNQWTAESGVGDQEIIDAGAANSGEALKALSRLREALQTLPFFGGGKAIWFRDCNFLADERTAEARAVTESLSELASELKEFDWQGVRLLISAAKVDKRKTFYKALDKTGTVETFEALSIEDRDWASQAEVIARKALRERKKVISDEALAELAATVGPNAAQLNNEAEKLALYAGDREEIEMGDVALICTKNKSSRDFALGDALGDRDLPRLMKTLDEALWEIRLDKKKSEIGLLYGLISKVRAMILVKEMLREGWIRPDSEFSGFKAQLARVPTSQLPDDKRYNPLALNPYVLYRALPQARRYTLAELVAAMEHLLRCNLQLVSSGLDRPLILQQTLVRIVEKRDVSASAAAAR